LGIDVGSVVEKNTDLVKVLIPEFISRDRRELKFFDLRPSLFSEDDLVEILDLRFICSPF
jgi:hypothetical protein